MNNLGWSNQDRIVADGRRDRSKTEVCTKRPDHKGGRSRSFWLLLVLLLLVFLMGGSSRKETPQLVVLRPVSVLMAFYAISTTTAEQWRAYRAPLVMAGAVFTFVMLHLVPLPPGIWQSLAGRGIIADVQRLVQQPDIWMPLSMVPDATWNAFYAFFTPLAVLFLAIQLDERDSFWLLFALTALGMLSALVGVLQGAGINLRLYSITSDTPPGLFANRNHQGALLATLFPMLATIASIGERFGLGRQFGRVLAAAVAVALMPLVLVTGSRTGLALSLLSIAMIPWLRLELFSRGAWARPRTKWLAGSAVAGTIGLVGLAGALTSRNAAVSRLSMAGEDLRYSIWHQVLLFLPDYLPWGSGIGSYVEVYQLNEPAALLLTSYSNHAHNDWLEVVMTGGLPALVLLAAAMVMFIVGAWRSAKAHGVGSKFNRLGLLMVMIMAIASVFDYPLRTPIMAAVFAVATVWSCRPDSAIREFKG